MALLFCDSFDHYDTAHMSEKYDQVLNGPSIVSGGRNTSSSPNNCASLSTGTLGRSVANAQTLIVGLAVNPGQLTTSALLTFNDSSSAQIVVSLLPSGQISVADGNTNVIGTTAPSLIPINVFSYVEVSVTFSTTATGAVAVQVNGVGALSVSNVITAITANASANAVLISYSTFPSSLIDDLYICDGTGTINNSFLGDIRVALALPNGTGRITSWVRTGGSSAGNYTAVNNNPPDDDASYVASLTVAAIDAYTITSIGTPAAIVAVQLVTSARKDDAGTRVVALGFGNTTTDNFDSGVSVPSGYTMIRRELDRNPITGNVWAATDLGSAQIAIKVVS